MEGCEWPGQVAKAPIACFIIALRIKGCVTGIISIEEPCYLAILYEF